MSLDIKEIKELVPDDICRNAVFAHAITFSRLPLCITDPSREDEPIVFANPAFCELTGYDEQEFLGKNCRFLQGPETTPESISAIRRALKSNEVTMVEIVNYKKNGERFINALQIGPVYDEDGELIFHFGSQLDISTVRDAERKAAALKTAELLHRLKNIVNVMTIVIKMTSRSATNPQQYAEVIASRLLALSRAHFDTLTDEKPKALHFKELAQMLLVTYAPMGEDQVQFTGDDVVLPESIVTGITLLLHELATNAVKHGSLGVEEGVVDLSWDTSDAGDLQMTWQERNGPKVEKPSRESGSRIVSTLIEASGGTLSFDWRANGLKVALTLPLRA